MKPTPKEIQAEENTRELVITYYWDREGGAAMAIISIILLAITAGIYGYDGRAAAIFIYLPFGVVPTYFAIAGILNKVIITANQHEASRIIRPMTWPLHKDVVVKRKDIKQLYVSKVVTKYKGKDVIRYSVMVVGQDDKPIEMVPDLDDPEKARYIEQKIESFWKIQNYPVPGEFEEMEIRDQPRYNPPQP